MPQRVAVAIHHWRIFMFIIPSKTLGPLMLISAGILLQANGALAATVAGDPQMQASDILSGTVGGRAKIVDVSPAISAGQQAFNPDPQQQARQSIMGKPNSVGIAGRAVAFDSKTKETTVVSVQSIRRTYADGQESARRVVLGVGA